MTLYLYDQPLQNLLFDNEFNDSFDDAFDDAFNDAFNDTFHDNFWNYSIIPRIPSRNQKNEYNSFENQLSRVFEDNHFNMDDINPEINIREDKNKYYILANLPGMTKDQIKMNISDDRILTISGEKESYFDNNNNNNNNNQDYDIDEDSNYSSEEEENDDDDYEEIENGQSNRRRNKNKDDDYSMMECSYDQFERSINIPEDANLDTIRAKMNNDVLKIIINKYKASKTNRRNIQIQ